jgi:xanthine dehydrogenase accessory factor
LNEIQAIVEAWTRLQETGESALLATVVKTEGSTYRRPGARMLFTRTGWVAGSISGGCLEADILQTAWERTQHGPALVTYDSTAHEDIVWGFGLGCNGIVQVLLERLSPDDSTLAFIADCLKARQTGVIATVLQAEGLEKIAIGDRLMMYEDGNCRDGIAIKGQCAAQYGFYNFLLNTVASAWQSERAGTCVFAPDSEETHAGTTVCIEVAFERIVPPRPLVILGAGQDALPVVRLAKQMGWHVTVVDPRSLASTPARFGMADAVIGCTPDALLRRVPLDAQTFALLMTHNFLHDADLLAQLLASPARYIGVLGPKKRLERLVAQLADEGITLTEEQRARLHGPVGLDIGADNPDEIALSILAEMQAIAANRTGGPLRDRQAPLHAETPRRHQYGEEHHVIRGCPLQS